MILKAIGKLPSAARQHAFAKSAQWREGSFVNVEPTQMMRPGTSYPKVLRDVLSRPKIATPGAVLPSVRRDLHRMDDRVPQIAWFGHSSYLISHDGYRVLVDPVLFGVSSPVSFIGKPFPVSNAYTIDDIPAIDLLVLSHDHYDHLDCVTLSALKSRIKRIVCSLGVSSHLVYWGFDANIITELDWHQQLPINDVLSITALPARHFSGRSLTRNKTLWNAYAFSWNGYKLFLGGDSGYDSQFSKTGEQHGPFDIAILECGQYGVNWPYIHMFPEETAQAARDLRARVLLPVHWAKFLLSNHGWKEPIERLLVAAHALDVAVLTPPLGGVVPIDAVPDGNRWWSNIP